jgi:hypothetical protein
VPQRSECGRPAQSIKPERVTLSPCIAVDSRWNAFCEPFVGVKTNRLKGATICMIYLKASALLRINEEHMRRQGIPEIEIVEYALALRTAMNEVAALWHNNLRFASEGSLRAFLGRIDRLRGIKGDALKKNSAELLNAAQIVVNRGMGLWTSRKK